MPHKVGEQYSPGAVDEKMRAGVATYAWIEANCPEISIPSYSAGSVGSWSLLQTKSNHRLARFVLTTIVPLRLPTALCFAPTRYWRARARRELSTETTSGGFMDDMLQFRENAFSAQPNAVNDEEDCRLQMLHMILLRRLKSHFVDQHFEGPFVLQFTDFHASNIFVDDQWNIVALVDLEFVCALPADMMEVPYWLTVNTIDEMTEHTDTATRMHELFVSILRDEERLLDRQKQPSRATSIHHAWMTDLCWFYCCFTSIDGIARCLEDHLYKKFNFEPSLAEERHYAKIISSRWSSESSAFVEQKLHDKARYDDDLARHFRGQAERRDELPLQRDLSCI
jgi:hypothetical protein